MIKPEKTLLDPHVYFDQMARTNEFIDAKRKMDLANAMARVALLVNKKEASKGGYLDIHGHALEMIGRLPDFIEGQRRLDEMRQRELEGFKVSRAKKEPELLKVIDFNHAVRETINNNPQLTTDEIRRFITMAHFKSVPPADNQAKYLENKLRGVLVGMQHEIAVEQALGSLDGVYDVRGGEREEDLEGVDLVATLDNGDKLFIDAKASLTGETKAWRNWMPGKPIPFWSGLEEGELGNRSRADEEQVGRVQGRILEKLVTDNQRLAI